MADTSGQRGHGARARPGTARPSSEDGAARVELTGELLARRYLEQRVSANQIAAETGWSSQYVRDRLREHGIRPRRGGGKRDPVERATVVRWIDDGLSLAQMADRAGYTRKDMGQVLRRIQLRAPTDATAEGRRDLALPAEEVIAAVARLYGDQQLSLAQVGAAFGRGPDWARARVVAAGLPLGQPRRHPAAPAEHDVTQWARWYADGLSLAEVAARAGRSRDSVARAFRNHHVQTRGRHRGSTTVTPDQVRELYVDQQLSLAQVAQRLGCATKRVKAALAVAGVAVRRSGPPANSGTWLPLDAAVLHDLYVVQHLSMAQIASRVGGSEARISAALRRYEIPRRRGTRRPAPGLDVDADTLHRLYVEQHLDDTTIAARYRVPTWRVTRRRRELGISRPPGPPPGPRPSKPPPARLLRRLYLEQGLPVVVIAQRYHTAAPKARRWLQDAGIPVRPRTSRADRAELDPDRLRELYGDREWSAAQIAAELDTTVNHVLRGLHDNGIPVRRGGTRARDARAHGGDVAAKLLGDLYGDPQINAVLRRHHVPRRPRPGPIADRFPTATPLTPQLLRDLYEDVGLSARQMELVTGQPHEQILDALHATDIEVRRDQGPAPWTTRRRG